MTIEPRTNKKGEVISYRLRCCVGRDAQRKQIWRTCTISRPEGLTPAKEQKEVERLAAEWEKQQLQDYEKDPVATDKSKITFKSFVEEHWLVDHVRTADHTPSSVKFFEYTSAEAVEFFGDKKKLREISVEDVKRFLNHVKTKENKRGETFGATSVKHFYGTLKNILGYAYRLRYIEENPCDFLSAKEKPRRERKTIDFLTPEQAKSFLACAETEPLFWKALIHVLLKEGVRRGECCGLQWRDVDEQNLELHVERNVILDKAAENGLHIGDTKTGESRTLPMSPQLCTLLKQLKQKQEEKFQATLLPSTFIFCNEDDPYRPIRPDSVTTKIRRFVEKHNLPNMSAHDLRHSAASLALEAGANLKNVQTLLGHRDPETTMRFYAAVTDTAQRETVLGIEALLEQA